MDERPVEIAETSDRPFDPAREPGAGCVVAIVDEAIGQVLALEGRLGLRRRQRRKADLLTLQATVGAVVCDLIHRELTEPGAWVAIPLSKQKLGGKHRARAAALGASLPKVLENLGSSRTCVIEMRKGNRSPFGQGRQTVIRRGPWLLEQMRLRQVAIGHLTRDPKVLPDPLVVRAKKVAGKKGLKCTVEDTEATRLLRVQMDRINSSLIAADLTSPSGTEERLLRRIFNNESIEQGGRLYGGFWQALRKVERRWIRIDGEPIVALDFGQMAVRIAYSFAKQMPPAGDLYRVPRFETRREGIKAVLNALLSAPQVPSRFPAGTRSKFHGSTRIGDVVAAIRLAHPALAPMFGTSVCHQIFFVESNILVLALLRLMDSGVVALPIHDCVLVASSAKGIAREVMLQVFHETTGFEGIVEEEKFGSYDDDDLS
jgi:hypothetical protein